MGRVHDIHGRHGSSAPSASVLHRRAIPKRKPSYKVVFEEVGGKRKKLKTLVCHVIWVHRPLHLIDALILPQLHGNSKPPTGYTFIPAGDPQLTSRCKQIAKAEGLTVFIVSVSSPNIPVITILISPRQALILLSLSREKHIVLGIISRAR